VAALRPPHLLCPRRDSNPQPTDSKLKGLQSRPYIWGCACPKYPHMGVKLSSFTIFSLMSILSAPKLHRKYLSSRGTLAKRNGIIFVFARFLQRWRNNQFQKYDYLKYWISLNLGFLEENSFEPRILFRLIYFSKPTIRKIKYY